MFAKFYFAVSLGSRVDRQYNCLNKRVPKYNLGTRNKPKMKANLPVPLRQRAWYAVVWCLLVLLSGAWTAKMAYLGYQLATRPPSTDVPGLAALNAQAPIIFSIPIYALFFGLLLCFPVRVKVKKWRPLPK